MFAERARSREGRGPIINPPTRWVLLSGVYGVRGFTDNYVLLFGAVPSPHGVVDARDGSWDIQGLLIAGNLRGTSSSVATTWLRLRQGSCLGDPG